MKHLKRTLIFALILATNVCAFTIMIWFSCNLGDFSPEVCSTTLSGTVHNEIGFAKKLWKNLR